MVGRPAFISEPLWRKYKLGGDRLKILKRQVLRFPRSPRLVAQYAAYRRGIKARDWQEVRRLAEWLAEYALDHRDRRLISEMAPALERVDRYALAGRLRLAGREFIAGRPDNEWTGEDLSGKSLLINFRETTKQGLGFVYRGANLVAKAARRAAHVAVILEPRAVPTYRRTFPDLEICGEMETAQRARFDYIAAFANLAGVFAPQSSAPDPDFAPLLADPRMVEELRARYRPADGRPVIGLCWYSGHHGKLLPEISHWRDLIDRSGAAFVSLQYGNVDQDMEVLGADRMIVDPAIDQLQDMDAFAAQVAAMDGVMTITATLGHVAGALGVPAVAVRDDWFRREWPVISDRVPWYPHLRAAGKDGRDWDPVLDEAWGKLQALMAAREGCVRKCD